jgi:hypothetical protein
MASMAQPQRWLPSREWRSSHPETRIHDQSNIQKLHQVLLLTVMATSSSTKMRAA